MTPVARALEAAEAEMSRGLNSSATEPSMSEAMARSIAAFLRALPPDMLFRVKLDSEDILMVAEMPVSRVAQKLISAIEEAAVERVGGNHEQ